MLAVSPDRAPSLQLLQYRRLFRGRLSDFALQYPTGRYARVGRALTEQDIVRHLRGEQTIGSYVINEQGMCWFAVYDADCIDGLEELIMVQARLASDGYPSYLEASRRGGHLWLFFARPLPASQVRAWFLPYCPAGFEFYPKQNEGCGYGSLIRLPYGVHQITGQRYSFVRTDGFRCVPVAFTLREQLAWLDGVQRIPVPPERREPCTLQRNSRPQEQSLTISNRTDLSDHKTIDAWCAQQDPLALIGSYVSLDHQGHGCCPFGDHHTGGYDHHPSFKVYTPRRAGGCCWYCYTWGRGGNVFNFLCFWYGVEPREMWRRIQQHEI
jgi:hypothetical protein